MNDLRRIAESSREAVKLIETLPTVCANRAFFPVPRLASWYMQDLSRQRHGSAAKPCICVPFLRRQRHQARKQTITEI